MREDLLPFSFGGNKSRIALEFFNDMKRKNCDCIIGYGSESSNLNRVIANMASSFLPDKRAYLIIPENYHETFNTKIAALCSAEIISCSKNEVPQAVDYAFDLCMKRGLKPYYINGNRFGKGNEAVPVRAYFDVYKMINDFAVNFSYIFLPVGTGMTYAGLIAGKHSISQNQNTNIIGISISRNKSKAEQDIRNYISAFNGNICDYAS